MHPFAKTTTVHLRASTDVAFISTFRARRPTRPLPSDEVPRGTLHGFGIEICELVSTIIILAAKNACQSENTVRLSLIEQDGDFATAFPSEPRRGLRIADEIPAGSLPKGSGMSGAPQMPRLQSGGGPVASRKRVVLKMTNVGRFPPVCCCIGRRYVRICESEQDPVWRHSV